jgi:hypothetical protein
MAASRLDGRSRIASACGSLSRSPGVSAPWTMPRLARFERGRQRHRERLVELYFDAGVWRY